MTAKILGFIGEHCWEIFQWNIDALPVGTIVYYNESNINWYEVTSDADLMKQGGVPDNNKSIRALSLEDVPKPYRVQAMLLL